MRLVNVVRKVRVRITVSVMLPRDLPFEIHIKISPCTLQLADADGGIRGI